MVATITQDRPQWMGLLARADEASLSELMADIADIPAFERLRGPEPGLVMVRGRTGGTGRPFNLGEMTVTRCTVRTVDGLLGHAYVAGRRPDHAERAALLDALLQDEARHLDLYDRIIRPLGCDEAERSAARRQESDRTRVDFFTMVRGEDE